MTTKYIITIPFVFITCYMFTGSGGEGFTGVPGLHIVSFTETHSEWQWVVLTVCEPGLSQTAP